MGGILITTGTLLLIASVGIPAVQGFRWLRLGTWTPFTLLDVALAVSGEDAVAVQTGWLGVDRIVIWALDQPAAGWAVLVSLPTLLLGLNLSERENRATAAALHGNPRGREITTLDGKVQRLSTTSVRGDGQR